MKLSFRNGKYIWSELGKIISTHETLEEALESQGMLDDSDEDVNSDR